jgi:hypothetical protein
VCAPGRCEAKKNENIVSMLQPLVTEANALSEGKSSVEIDQDPRICGLMLQAEPIIEELDSPFLFAPSRSGSLL